jgi:holo-[acyl-carrier protein] synthase
VILGLGLDLVEVARIRRLRELRGERFLHRVYTPHELGACQGRSDQDNRLAARFAAKEAGMKALGTGWAAGVGWHDLEVIRDRPGPPSLRLSGAAARKAAELGVRRAHLTLSHDAGVAAAVVVLEGGPGTEGEP